jgi:DNA-binding transcriptional LysR family regulator
LLSRSGLSLERLASFVAIAEAGGLSAAAQGDAVRQSQLSRQLKELEEFFGVTLIERRRGVFRLTSAGRGLLEIARPALVRLEDFDRRCGAQLNEVHLGAGESVLVWLVAPRLRTLLAREAKAAFTLHNLQSEDILARLRDGRLDFGVLRGSAVSSGLLSASLGEVEYTLFVPTGAGRKCQKPALVQVLAETPLALLDGSNAVNDALADWASAHGIRLNVRLRCTSLVQAAAAVQKLGMAAVLPVWAESGFTAGTVERLGLVELKALQSPLRLVWSKRQVAIRPFLGPLAKGLARSLSP